MPTKAKKNPRPWHRGYSNKSETKMESRPRSRDEYHSARWTRESKAFREKYPLCEICRKAGRITPAEVVDHIVPVAMCGDFWDKTNWQSVCRKCNIEKGNRDKKLINGK